MTSPWSIADIDALTLRVPDHDVLIAGIHAQLAAGVPVTLVDAGRKLVTYYPDGTSENHQRWPRW